VLDADVVVPEAVRLGLGGVQHAAQALAHVHRAALHAGQASERLLGLPEQCLAGHTQFLEHGGHGALRLLQERGEQVLGL
jgi:hypothetical protein